MGGTYSVHANWHIAIRKPYSGAYEGGSWVETTKVPRNLTDVHASDPWGTLITMVVNF